MAYRPIPIPFLEVLSVSPTVRPLVWSLLFTFKCWIKEHKHIEKKKRKKQRWKCWVLSNSGWASINAADLLRLFQTVKPVWTLTGMTSDSLKRRFGLPIILHHNWQHLALPKGQLSSDAVANNSRQSKKKNRSLSLSTKWQNHKPRNPADCTEQLRVASARPCWESTPGRKKTSALSDIDCHYSDTPNKKTRFFKVHISWEQEHRIREANMFHVSRTSLKKWGGFETQGKPFVPLGMRALCIDATL